MDWQRYAYIGGILLVSLTLVYKWNEFEDRQVDLATSAPVAEIANTGNDNSTTDDSLSDIPSVPNNTATQFTAAENNSSDARQLIKVTTGTLELLIDPLGGDIVKAVLIQHKVKLNGEQGFTILDNTGSTLYIAQSGLVAPKNTPDTPGTDNSKTGRPIFSSAKNEYALTEGDNDLIVDLVNQQGGVTITKRFEFQRDNYLIQLSYLINNQTTDTWQANLYGQIKRDNHEPPVAADAGFGVNPFYGAATTTSEDKYEKLKFSEIDKLSKEDESFDFQGGWVAMVQHYFTSAWIPNSDVTNHFTIEKLGNSNYYRLGFLSPTINVAPGSQGELSAQFYVGPKDIDQLEAIAENLDLTVDYGFLWWIAKPLFHLLDYIHTYIGNWGWSIIVLTIIIKAIFFYPSAMSYRSMAKMRKVAPKMQQLKERYGDDRQKMSQEMMKLYKKEKVNPLGGCLPILIQMPVFISLYWMLRESVELRHAPFALWIKDLTVMDPYFVFPLIMGATMFIQQRLNPTPPDPMQAKIMQWMPIGFTFLFLWFPAGLVIYWVTNNTLSIIQQYLITRAIEKGSD